MSNKIVQVNESITEAAAPDTLQNTGAAVTQGGTNTDPGTLTLLSNAAGLDAIIAPPITLTALSWTSDVVTATASGTLPWNIGDMVEVVIAGALPSGYNGTFLATVTGASDFTYPLGVDPGTATAFGTATLFAANELQQMIATFYAQPQAVNQSVYVLELGEGDPAAGPPLLFDFITDNQQTIYSYLIPREWDGLTGFTSGLSDYDSPNALIYFYVTTTVANRALYAGHKCVQAIVEAPDITNPLEFSMAAQWAAQLNYNPSSTNQVPPSSYTFVYGVTPYPLPGNQTVFTELNTANVGWIGTRAEGEISTAIVFYGQMQDGNPFSFWYSADWANLNLDLNLSNEVINGSNDPQAPLYYNQQGINRLQNRCLQTLGTAVAYGLALGTVKGFSLPAATFRNNYLNGDYEGLIAVNAEPFGVYTNENPGDYAIGRYAGLAVVYTPSRGFKQIVLDLNVTNIVGSP